MIDGSNGVHVILPDDVVDKIRAFVRGELGLAHDPPPAKDGPQLFSQMEFRDIVVSIEYLLESRGYTIEAEPRMFLRSPLDGFPSEPKLHKAVAEDIDAMIKYRHPDESPLTMTSYENSMHLAKQLDIGECDREDFVQSLHWMLMRGGICHQYFEMSDEVRKWACERMDWSSVL